MLRERGIYALPDNREFIAHRSGRELYSLYPWQPRQGFERAEYVVSADGHLLSKSVPTRWRVEDLADTGRTD